MEKFKSKIDIWIVLFLSAIFVPITVKMAYDRTWGVFFMLLVIALIIHMFRTTYYVIEEKRLRIRSGFLVNILVDIQDIIRISETNNIMSSPALSFDRLEVLYNKFDSVMISPKEKARFIEAIKKVNPQVEIILKE